MVGVGKRSEVEIGHSGKKIKMGERRKKKYEWHIDGPR